VVKESDVADADFQSEDFCRGQVGIILENFWRSRKLNDYVTQSGTGDIEDTI